jgi:Asp-tRNA(Asn)/Glu-tRNA(Gln) amidotransferase A subunit family amidase
MPYSPAEYRGLTFHDAAVRFSTGDDTPRAYLERCLATIAMREPGVKAWACLNEKGAREAADAATTRYQAGAPLSAIDGLPIGIKDLLETRDMPTEMGCDAYRGNFPKRDNAAVWALRQAGAIILGKTVTTELGGAHPPPTTNPFDAAHTPGGSSSGSAAAVAASMVPACIGTQVGGSIVRPASYCGNVALKPTQGAINRGERQATSQSTHGVHANCVEDMWQVAIEIAKRAGGDPGSMALFGPPKPPLAQRPVVLGVMETEGWTLLSESDIAAFDAILDQLRAAGVIVLRRSNQPMLETFERAIAGCSTLGNTITAWENHWNFRNLVAQHPDGVSVRTKSVITTAENLGPDGYRALVLQRQEIRTKHAALAPVVDALIAPASPGPAPKIVEDQPDKLIARPTGNSVFNVPSSVLGAPVVNLPLTAVGGLPMGIQILGQPHTDARCAGYARWMLETLAPVVV